MMAQKGQVKEAISDGQFKQMLEGLSQVPLARAEGSATCELAMLTRVSALRSCIASSPRRAQPHRK